MNAQKRLGKRSGERRMRVRRKMRVGPVAECCENRRLLSVSLVGVPTWGAQGPAPVLAGGVVQESGAVNAIAIDLKDSTGNSIYIGCTNGGVWHTSNGLSANPSWTPLTDFQASLGIGTLAVNPTSYSEVFAGTPGYSNARGVDQPKGHVYRSRDNGVHWSEIGGGVFKGMKITKILPSTLPNVVLVATDQGVYRSENDGDTFVQVRTGAATDLIETHDGPSTVFFAALPGNGSAGGGIVRSNDGTTWTSVNNDIDVDLVKTENIKLAAHEDPTNVVVYAAVGNDQGAGGQITGIFRSTSFGNSWTDLGVPAAGVGTDFEDCTLAADPVDRNLVYFGGYGGFADWVGDASKDAAHRWTALLDPNRTPYAHADHRSFVFDPNGDLLEGDDGGIYRLTNPRDADNRKWVPMDGNLQATELYDLAYDDHNNIFLGGTQDQGNIAQSASGSSVWGEVEGGDGTVQAVDNSDPNFVYRYAGQISGGHVITRSVYDNNNHLVSSTSVSGDSVTLNQSDPTHVLLITSDNHLWQSTDRGLTFPADITPTNCTYINGVAYKGQTIYVAGNSTSNKASVFFSTTDGASWTQLNYTGDYLPDSLFHFLSDVAIDPSDSRTAYFLDHTDDVWQVAGAGTSGEVWTRLTGNLNDISGYPLRVASIKALELNTAGGPTTVLLVGNQTGVYRAFNPQPGKTNLLWTRFGWNLPRVLATEMVYDTTDQVFAVGTFGRGAWSVPTYSLALPGVLQITGDSDYVGENDTVVVQPDTTLPGWISVFLNGIRYQTLPASCLTSIQIDGGSGSDVIDLNLPYNSLAVTVKTGGGPDTLNVEALGDFSTLQINGGAQPASVNVCPTYRNLTTMTGTVSISGPAGAANLAVYDDNFAGNATYFVNTAPLLTIPQRAPGSQAFSVTAGGSVSGFLLSAGSGHDVVNVAATRAGQHVTINGSEVVNVGSAKNLSYIQGPVTVSNPFGFTDLRISDEDNATTPHAAVLDSTSVTNLAAATIDFVPDDLSSLTVIGGSAGNTFTVKDTVTVPSYLRPGAGINTVNVLGTTRQFYIQGNGGTDRVAIGSTNPDPVSFDFGNGHMDPIKGDVYVSNPAGNVILYVDDGGGTTGKNVTMADGSISGFASGTVHWTAKTSASGGVVSVGVFGGGGGNVFTVKGTSDMQSATQLNTGTGSNTVNVLGTTGELDIYGNASLDTVVVGGTLPVGSGNVKDIKGKVFVTNGGAGATRLYVDDSADTTGHSVTLGAAQLTGLAPAAVSWTPAASASGGVTELHVVGSGGNDTIVLTVPVPSIPTSLDGAGGTGDTLVGPDVDTTWSLTGTDSGAVGVVAFSNVENLTGGSHDDSFKFSDAGSISGNLDGGAGTDTLDYSAVAGPVTVDFYLATTSKVSGKFQGIENVVGSLSNNDTIIGPGSVWTISGPNSGSVDNVAFSSFENLTGAPGPDTFIFLAGGSITGNVDGGGGKNVLDYSHLTTPATIDLANGKATGIGGTFANITGVTTGSGGGKVVGPNVPTTWLVTGVNAVSAFGVDFTNCQSLTGGSSDDTFLFKTGGRLDGSIDGGGGTNTLSYSSYVGNVTVNLGLHTATATGGVFNVQNVIGSQGDGLLVGDAAANVLVGGTGRNVIIGGAGRDRLDAGPSGDDNILIGGTTAWDGNPAALAAVMAEWTRTDLGYGDRFSDLTDGTNSNRNKALNRVNGHTILLAKSTVFGDSAADTLTGGKQSSPVSKFTHDWFYTDRSDVITNLKHPGDHETKV